MSQAHFGAIPESQLPTFPFFLLSLRRLGNLTCSIVSVQKPALVVLSQEFYHHSFSTHCGRAQHR